MSSESILSMAIKKSGAGSQEINSILESLFICNPAMMMIFDPVTSEIVDANPSACSFYGYSHEEFVKLSLSDIDALPKNQLDLFIQNIKSEHKTHFCVEHRLSNGEIRCVEVQGCIITLSGRLYIYSIIHDITERKKTENEIKKLNSELEKIVAFRTRILEETNAQLKKEIAERMLIEDALRKSKFDAEQANLAKSQFLANMSHEIRTPINGIIGMTDLALMSGLTSEQREYLTIVKSSTKQLLRVLNDILDYSKIEAGKVELEKLPFNIRKTTYDVIDLFTIAGKRKNLYIKVNFDGRIPMSLIGDSVRFRQVLSNLVDNGIKFTAKGGVTVNVLITAIYADSVQLKFVVSDTGIGISNDKLDKLFKRFSQVDDSNTRQFGGTGLGLAISKKLVEMMGGEIGVVSKKGKGSDFYFTVSLGMQPDDLRSRNADSALNDSHTGKPLFNKKILLAEDDEVCRNLASIHLTKCGCKVTTAQNGREAVNIFSNQSFDLILIDINMPYLDGYSAASIIRQMERAACSHTPIIAMTAYALNGDKEKCLAAGIDDYIPKPVDFKLLFNVIDRWTSSG